MNQPRASSVTLIIALASLALPAAVLAAPALTLTPSVGPATTSVRLSGAGFGATEGVDIFFDSLNWVLAATDGSGNLSQTFLVPLFASQGALGTHWVTAIGRRSGRTAQKPFLVRTDWLQYHYGVAHRGFNRFENALDSNTIPSLAEAWVAHTGDSINSSPAVAGGVVYVGSRDNKLYAFSASQGKLLTGWPVSTKGFIVSSPAVAGGVVYVGSADGQLYAFNALNAALRSRWPVVTRAAIPCS